MFNNQYNPWQAQLQNMQNQLQQLQQMTSQHQTTALPVMPVMQPTVQIQSVKGLEGANAYSLPNQSSIILLDTDEPVFYMKMTDANGRETVKEYEFSEKNSVKTEKIPAEEENKDKEIIDGRLNAFSANLEKYQSKIDHLEGCIRNSDKQNYNDIEALRKDVNTIKENIKSFGEMSDCFIQLQEDVRKLIDQSNMNAVEISKIKDVKKVSSKEAKT